MLLKYHATYKNLQMKELNVVGRVYWYCCKEETDFGTFYFEAPKTARHLTTDFAGLSVIEPEHYWYSYDNKKFMHYEDFNGDAGTAYWLHSYKALKRFLKKHTDIQVAYQFVRWQEHSIIFVRKGVK